MVNLFLWWGLAKNESDNLGTIVQLRVRTSSDYRSTVWTINLLLWTMILFLVNMVSCGNMDFDRSINPFSTGGQITPTTLLLGTSRLLDPPTALQKQQPQLCRMLQLRREILWFSRNRAVRLWQFLHDDWHPTSSPRVLALIMEYYYNNNKIY